MILYLNFVLFPKSYRSEILLNFEAHKKHNERENQAWL